MKTKRNAFIFGLAITSGLLAGALALGFLRQQPRSVIAAEAPKGKLVVAMRDLPLGAIVKPQDVHLIDWPSNVLPAGYAGTAAEVVGHGLVAPVHANEPILRSKLAGKESGGGLAIVIPEGMRAISVKVDEVVGVAGFVLPGTRVDVLVIVQPPQDQGTRNPISRVILQNIQVLAAGQTIQRDAEGKPQTVSVVTLLVTPAHAEELALAATEGRIQLALRNAIDLERTETEGVRIGALVSERAPARRPTPTQTATPRRAAPAESGFVVENIRGGERTLSTFTPKPQ